MQSREDVHSKEPDNLKPVISINALTESFDQGLRNFSGVEQKLLQNPEFQKVLQDYTAGKVVLRGFHRFAASPAEREKILTALQLAGIDRTAGVSHTGEGFHVAAAFLQDDWRLALAYTAESEADKRPSTAKHSIGIMLVYDNSDGAVVYVDPIDRTAFAQSQSATKKIDMARRDEMFAVIADTPQGKSPAWSERLLRIIVIEYPFIPRPEGILTKLQQKLLRKK